MNIVILDGGTTNPGDISWKAIETLGNLTIYDTTDAKDVISRSINADIIIINRIVIDKNVLDNLPNLKCIATFSTGFNTIDLLEAKNRGIPVCNVPVYCLQTVAQMTFALILALTNHVESHSNYVKNGMWNESIKFGQTKAPFVELWGKTLGIVGYGGIGKEVAKLGKAFGMNVIAYSKSQKDIETVSIEEVFKNSDIVSLHCALNDDTKGLVNMELLKLMKSSALLVNTARGGLINEAELAEALANGTLAGAATDVITDEPPSTDNPLLKLDNFLVTPHIAWSSKEARLRLIDVVANNIKGFINKEYKNVVNP